MNCFRPGQAMAWPSRQCCTRGWSSGSARTDVLRNFVANYEQAYGELRTDYLLRKQGGAV